MPCIACRFLVASGSYSIGALISLVLPWLALVLFTALQPAVIRGYAGFGFVGTATVTPGPGRGDNRYFVAEAVHTQVHMV